MTTMRQTTEGAKALVLDAFTEGLNAIGYPQAQIQREYGYSNFLGDGQRQVIDLAAFGGAVPSLRTCNIGVVVEEEATSASLSRLHALGAPLLFSYSASGSQVSRWKMPAVGSPEQLGLPQRIHPDRLPDFLVDHKAEWEPESFRQARAATFRDTAAQLDFFDVGLLPALEGHLQRKLSDQLQKTTARSREIVSERDGSKAFEKQFSQYARLLFRLLAARLLSDREDVQDLKQTSDVAFVLGIIEGKYHTGEVVEPVLSNPVVKNQVWDDLRNGLDLRNLSPETLAFVYENTLVDPDVRKSNGIHATPPLVADYMLRQLPVELIPESERVVFEPFCGNAPFLLAAMRRLRDLLPANRTPAQVHQYLVERLLGIEILPFAREIARYSLILGDYPNENSWKIALGNAYIDRTFDEYLQQSKIVLSNPPHENFTTSEHPANGLPNRAAEALRRVLEVAPSMLGFVMPLTFVDGRGYKSLRRRLAETYPDISLTAMPDNVFSKASQATVLVCAHRLGTQRRYFQATVAKQDYLTAFALTGQPTLSTEREALEVDSGGEPVLWEPFTGNLAEVWQALAHFKVIDSVAELHRGLSWENQSGTRSTDSFVSWDEHDGFQPGLNKVESYVENYVALKVPNIDTRPEQEQRRTKALGREWNRPKVLVNDARIGGAAWRVLAIVDNEGLYASKRFVGVWPRLNEADVTPVELLSAVLSGFVANAFVHNLCRGRDNNMYVLRRVPLPSFTASQTQEIATLTNAYIDLRWEHEDVAVPWTGMLAERGRRALLKIDAAVLEAYGLTPEAEAALLNLFKDAERSHLPFTFKGLSSEEWAQVKAELADDRRGRQIADQFAALLTKRNLHGLTDEEEANYNRLKSLRTERRMQYRTLIASGK